MARKRAKLKVKVDKSIVSYGISVRKPGGCLDIDRLAITALTAARRNPLEFLRLLRECTKVFRRYQSDIIKGVVLQAGHVQEDGIVFTADALKSMAESDERLTYHHEGGALYFTDSVPSEEQSGP